MEEVQEKTNPCVWGRLNDIPNEMGELPMTFMPKMHVIKNKWLPVSSATNHFMCGSGEKYYKAHAKIGFINKQHRNSGYKHHWNDGSDEVLEIVD